MGDVIKLDDSTRVDKPSQKVLTRLNANDWVYTGDLQDAAELSQNTQVLYRMEEHLIPSGLVEEADRPNTDYPRQFRLTKAGKRFIREHSEDIAQPTDRLETQKMASKALNEASSAKESVQGYRKKLHRLKQRIEEVETWEERIESVEQSLEYHSGSISGLRERKVDEEDLTSLHANVLTLDKEQDKKRKETVEQFRQHLNRQEMAIEGLQEEITTLRKENEQLRSELAKIKEWRAQGPVQRLFDND